MKSAVVTVTAIMQSQSSQANSDLKTVEEDPFAGFYLPELKHEVNRLKDEVVQKQLLDLMQKCGMKSPSDLLTKKSEKFQSLLLSSRVFRQNEAEKILKVWKTSESKSNRFSEIVTLCLVARFIFLNAIVCSHFKIYLHYLKLPIIFLTVW